MIIVKVMVCFLAIFGREDSRLVGGLPVVQGPPDGGQAAAGGEQGAEIGDGGVGSNQRIANEPTTTAASAILGVAEKYREDKKEPVGEDDGRRSSVDEATGGDLIFESLKMTGDNTARRFSSVYRKSGGSSELGEKFAEGERGLENQPSDSDRLAEALHAAVERRGRESGIPETIEILGDEGDDAEGSTGLDTRQRKSVNDPELFTGHQQTTNMRPIRKQHTNVQEKRNVKGEGNAAAKNRREFDAADGRRSGFRNDLQPGLSHALYHLGPAQLHALKGVFDKTPAASPRRNFKPIPAKQIAYVPPRIIYETKLIPAPFAAFGTEQKTVDALSALLGQTPDRQLEGLNLILGKNEPRGESFEESPTTTGLISRQDDAPVIANRLNFVTPIPSVDINEGLAEDAGFGFSNEAGDEREIMIGGGFKNPFVQPGNTSPDNDYRQEFVTEVDRAPPGAGYRTIIPIVETSEVRGRRPVWEETRPSEEPSSDDSSRYPNHREEGETANGVGSGYAARYNFGYHVEDYETGNNFGHEEERDGVITNGRYYVLLPDGRVQNVKYHVDEGGYHAKVSYQLNSNRSR